MHLRKFKVKELDEYLDGHAARTYDILASDMALKDGVMLFYAAANVVAAFPTSHFFLLPLEPPKPKKYRFTYYRRTPVSKSTEDFMHITAYSPEEACHKFMKVITKEKFIGGMFHGEAPRIRGEE